jgi:hypothetical protein
MLRYGKETNIVYKGIPSFKYSRIIDGKSVSLIVVKQQQGSVKIGQAIGAWVNH